MEEESGAIQYLEQLREENGRRIWGLKSFNRYLDQKARQMGVPLTGQFELTPLCNFNCRMCYVHLDNEHMNGRKLLTVETWKDLIHQAWEAGMVHVTLSGGECLTYPGFDEIYMYVQSLGCDVSILTNGFLLDDKRIEFFKQHKPSMIQITLYGSNDEAYERVTGKRAFSTVLENIHKAIEAGFYVKLVITPSMYMDQDVLETVRIARAITSETVINSTIFPPREETGRSEQHDSVSFDQYVRIFKLIRRLDGIETKKIDPERLPPVGGPSHACDKCGLLCGGGRSGFVVDWKGNIMPCNSLDMVRADLLEVGFRQGWMSIHDEVAKWPWVPECQGCAYYKVCHRCAGIMIQYAEPGKQPKEMCESIRLLAQNGLVQIQECE